MFDYFVKKSLKVLKIQFLFQDDWYLINKEFKIIKPLSLSNSNLAPESQEIFLRSKKKLIKGWYLFSLNHLGNNNSVFAILRQGKYGFAQARPVYANRRRLRILRFSKKDYLYVHLKNVHEIMQIKEISCINIPFIFAWSRVVFRYLKLTKDHLIRRSSIKYIWKNYNSFLLKQENQKNWIDFQEIQNKKKFEYQSFKPEEQNKENNQQIKDNNLISVRNLTKSYLHKGKKVNVFKNISFDIKKGDSVALLGRNGAGKSTLLRILGGIDQADSGTVDSNCSISWPVGLVGGFQGSLSARENVTFVSKIYVGNNKDLIQEKVEKVEDFAEIGIYFDRPFKTYSSGMRSRITFGLSMAFDFDIYLIDEVTSAGDERFRKKSKETLQRLHQRADFIMVDHNLWGLEFHCDKALLLHDGSLLQYDDIGEAIMMHKKLLEHPIK